MIKLYFSTVKILAQRPTHISAVATILPIARRRRRRRRKEKLTTAPFCHQVKTAVQQVGFLRQKRGYKPIKNLGVKSIPHSLTGAHGKTVKLPTDPDFGKEWYLVSLAILTGSLRWLASLYGVLSCINMGRFLFVCFVLFLFFTVYSQQRDWANFQI